MDCHKIHELLPDLAAGMEPFTPEVEQHIASCEACSAQLHDFQKTMALLDEWRAPEPSTSFDTPPPASWYSRILPSLALRPVWLTSVAAVIFTVALAVGNQSYISQTETIATRPPSLTLPVQPGTAVGDLQALEKNNELYADFDVLDDLQVQDDVTANP